MTAEQADQQSAESNVLNEPSTTVIGSPNDYKIAQALPYLRANKVHFAD